LRRRHVRRELGRPHRRGGDSNGAAIVARGRAIGAGRGAGRGAAVGGVHGRNAIAQPDIELGDVPARRGMRASSEPSGPARYGGQRNVVCGTRTHSPMPGAQVSPVDRMPPTAIQPERAAAAEAAGEGATRIW
jgi:hypothetical protein